VTFNGQEFWIGLRKNDSTLVQVYQSEDDILTTDGECLMAKLNKSSLWEFKTNPCTWLRTSFCAKLTGKVCNYNRTPLTRTPMECEIFFELAELELAGFRLLYVKN
jgi:hypothetical protein